MTTIRIVFFCLLPILFATCANDDNNNNDIDCNAIACTEIFVTLTVTVKDAFGVAIPLDTYKVINVSNGEDLTPELSASGLEIAKQNGTYPLFGDENASRFQNDSLIVLFKGYIDGNEAVSTEYKVGADCCHVQLLSGDTEIVIVN